jgi:non-heme chloroperoxidase
MFCGFKNAYDCTKAFSETDFTEDLKKMDTSVLLLYREKDQIVPIVASAEVGIKLLPKGQLKVYPGGAHALPNTEIDKSNQNLLDFLES